MTAHRIHHTDKPVSGYGRVLPMTDADADFWRLRKQPTPPERGGWLRFFRRK